MFKAICIKKFSGFYSGEIVKVVKGIGPNVHFYKGCHFSLNTPKEKFEEHFLPFKNYYIVERPPKKIFFFIPKKSFLRVEFKDISDRALQQLYICVFSYIEYIKAISPELIQAFSYSIISTLEKLEYLYPQLTEAEFIEAVQDSEQVFEGIYKTALTMELELIPSLQKQSDVLKQFKQENAILKQFYEDFNK